MPKPNFSNSYTRLQREIIDSLAEIEKEDADRCANCGSEDCICCEYYHDRQKWVEPDELFGSEQFDDWHDDDYYYRDDFEYEEE